MEEILKAPIISPFPTISTFFLQLLLYLLSLVLFSIAGRILSRKGVAGSNVLEGYPLIGNLPDFLRNRHRLLEWFTEIIARQPTNTAVLWRPGEPQLVITGNPMNVEHILKNNFDNYPKGEAFNEVMHDFLGTGIFNSDGEMWKVQRKTAISEFSKRSLRNFIMVTVHREIQNRLLPFLQTASDGRKTIDLQDVFERFGFDNICMLAFNEDPMCLSSSADPSSAAFAAAFDGATSLSVDRFRHALRPLYKLKRRLNIGSERDLSQSISVVHDFAMKIIKSRRQNLSSSCGASKEDLISRFMSSDEGISDEFLRDVAVNFILAGRDSTSSTLAWFFWELSTKPEVEKKIVEELKSIRARHRSLSSMPGWEELAEMHYLHATITEVIRFHPPIALDTRVCRDGDRLPDGTFVGKGWYVAYVAYAMGRMVEIWGSDVGRFAPERWLSEEGVFRPESSHRFSAFHAGPRVCLGKEMAYLQMKSIVAAVLERFEVDVLEKERCPEQILSLVVKMKGGLPAKVREKITKTEM